MDLLKWWRSRFASRTARPARRQAGFRPRLEALEDRLAPANVSTAPNVSPPTLTIVGVDQGPPHVKVLGGTDGTTVLASFYAFDPAFQGGVRVAIGDVNGDGVLDYICGAGPGAQAHVKVVDGTKANQVLSN